MLTDEQKRIVFPKYAQLICEPGHWLRIAQYLFASAEKLEPEIERLWKNIWDSILHPLEEKTYSIPFQPSDYQRVYLMLIAYCLENLLKGYLVKINKQDIYSEALRTGELPTLLKTHDLQRLAKKCPLQLDENGVQILHRLSYHSMWIGRYPYPLKADQYYYFAEGSTVPGSAVGWSSNEISLTKAFVEEVAKQVEMQLRP